MKKEGKFFLQLVYLLTFSSFQLFASPQRPDYIIYEGDTTPTYNLILEQYLQLNNTSSDEKLFGLVFRMGASTSCWRGYQAIYKIENDSLFLVEILNCGELSLNSIDKSQSIEKLKAIFGDKLQGGKVYIDWFSGDINFPLTNKIIRWDGVFYTIFEKERVVKISNGKVGNIIDVENYVDDPKRIDRRLKEEISAVLVRQLKKTNWKNINEFDCSERYLVTIDEMGEVSKVSMTYADDEIEKHFVIEEYHYCLNRIYHELRNLKFDIIKDKGKAISEIIFIEIWIKKNGRIENWTD